MTEGALPARPAGAHRRQPAARSAAAQLAEYRRTTTASAVRLGVSLGLIGLAYLTLRDNERIRDFEAWLAGHVITVAARLPSGNSKNQPIVWFPNKTQEIGLVITPECTVALLMVPFIIATALLVWQRVPLIRPMLGLVLAAVMLIIVNQLRLLGIVLFVKHMGFASGFYWGHTLVGSIITIAGLASSLATFALMAVRRRRLVRRGLAAEA
jgi:exosortase/archaeosortase family protein